MSNLKPCIICKGETVYFFTKNHQQEFKNLLPKSEFHECTNCGFVISQTIRDMPEENWNKLNVDFHHLLESGDFKENINQPPYLEQSTMLNVLIRSDLISDKMLDYAGGYGTLSKIMYKYNNITIPVFDPYVIDNNSSVTYLNQSDLDDKKFDVVINSALFEHIRSIGDLDKIDDLVSNDGTLIIHTVVCEKIPNNPDWFYVTPPVHSALHTNKSMNILMERWGYKSSIYCPSSKFWVLFKNKLTKNQIEKINKINSLIQTKYLHYKDGFMDYWK